MKAEERSFPVRCYIRYVDGLHEAICIDLNLATQGHTQKDAIQSLIEAMQLYLEPAVEDPSLLDSLIPRKSPISLRMKYHWVVLSFAIARFVHDIRRAVVRAMRFDKVISWQPGGITIA